MCPAPLISISKRKAPSAMEGALLVFPASEPPGACPLGDWQLIVLGPWQRERQRACPICPTSIAWELESTASCQLTWRIGVWPPASSNPELEIPICGARRRDSQGVLRHERESCHLAPEYANMIRKLNGAISRVTGVPFKGPWSVGSLMVMLEIRLTRIRRQ